MLNQSHKSKQNHPKNNPYKEYFQVEDIDNPIFLKSISFFNKEYLDNKIDEIDFKETALEIKINKQLDGKELPKRKRSIYISSKEIKKTKLEQSLRDIGVLTSEKEEHLVIRKLPEISEEKFNQIQQKIINNNSLNQLYEQLQNVNIDFKDPECHISIGGINPLSYLIKKYYNFEKAKEKEMKDKFNILQPYIYNFRTIFGDGNCFYRAVIFRYLEILILSKNVDILKKVVFDVIESFKSEELQKRRIIINMDIEPDLTFKIIFLIIHLLKEDKMMEAYKILFKSFSTCRKFDYAIILYFRYILYDYIKKNENKIYLESFPIKIGNLLPSQFETESGDFLFNPFYENYLLKFYTDAEKIIVYLAPFVLGIELNVVVFDLEGDILQKFVYEGKSEIKTDSIISLLNKKNHYEIIYTKKDKEENKKYFEIFENNMDRIISFPEAGNNNDSCDDDDDFRLFRTNKKIVINSEINQKEINYQNNQKDIINGNSQKESTNKNYQNNQKEIINENNQKELNYKNNQKELIIGKKNQSNNSIKTENNNNKKIQYNNNISENINKNNKINKDIKINNIINDGKNEKNNKLNKNIIREKLQNENNKNQINDKIDILKVNNNKNNENNNNKYINTNNIIIQSTDNNIKIKNNNEIRNNNNSNNYKFNFNNKEILNNNYLNKKISQINNNKEITNNLAKNNINNKKSNISSKQANQDYYNDTNISKDFQKNLVKILSPNNNIRNQNNLIYMNNPLNKKNNVDEQNKKKNEIYQKQ